MKIWLFYCLDAFLELLLEAFWFSRYRIIGKVSKSEGSNVLCITQTFYGFSRSHAKYRFKQHSSVTGFDRIVAIKVRG